MDARLPPAVVLGIDTPIGLTIIRELGQHGVRVTGIGWSAQAIGMASRYLAHGVVRAGDPEALIAQLEALGRELCDVRKGEEDKGGEGKAGEGERGQGSRPCLFAISESDISLLNRHRERLSGFCLMFADEARMARVLNKEQTYSAAARVGIRVPRTEQVASLAEAERVGPGLRFPVVLKWANPNEVVRALSAAGCRLDKTHYCYSLPELLDYLRPYGAVGLYPLIQEYCAGYGLGQFVLMKDGVAHASFQHRRVHEWPPEGGFSSLCESVAAGEHAAQMRKSVALLRELDWEGIAMVEYRHDPATGESALMEINGRFWGSLPLAYHAGAAFPWLMYRLFGQRQAVAQPAYRAGVRCRFMIPETKRLLRILFQQGRIADRQVSFARLPALAGYLADFLRPRSRYYVFEWRDAAPFFHDLRQMAGGVLERVFKR